MNLSHRVGLVLSCTAVHGIATVYIRLKDTGNTCRMGTGSDSKCLPLAAFDLF